MQGSNLVRDFKWDDQVPDAAKQKTQKQYEPQEPIRVVRFYGTLKPLFPAPSDSQQLHKKGRVVFYDNASGDFRPFRVY